MKLRILSSLRMLRVQLSPWPPSRAAEKPLHKFLPIEDKSNVSLAYIWLDIARKPRQDVDALAAVLPSGITAETSAAPADRPCP